MNLIAQRAAAITVAVPWTGALEGADIHVDWTRLPASPNVAGRLGIGSKDCNWRPL